VSKTYFDDRYVPDEGPEDSNILFVGEAPGETEYEKLQPFVGTSGELFMQTLDTLGVSRGEVRLANLCHYRPYNNKFENLVGTKVLEDGVKELIAYIERTKPNLIVPLGGQPLRYLTGKVGIKKWRGSILETPINQTKCIPTFHPAAVLRDRGLYPTFKIDLRRILGDATFRDRRLPERRFIIDPRGLECEEWVEKLCNARSLGTDIETVKKSKIILCVGFAPSPDLGVCFVPSHPEGRRAIERILESNARKIFQFGSFDYRQLVDNSYQINDPDAAALDRIYYWDTLIAQHVLAPELPRSLEYLTSIYTREPYYKTEGRGSIPDDTKGWSLKVNKQSLYEYNCRDCCCTIEISQIQEGQIEADRAHVETFNFEMSMLEVADHISVSGLPIDDERRQIIEDVTISKWSKKQFVLDRMTGYVTNVHSTKLLNILYDKDKLGLPVRRNRKSGKLTADEDAIVSLIAYCKDKMDGVVKAQSKLEWQIKLAICQTILEIRGLRKLLSSYILARTKQGQRISDDGRIRSLYKVGGTETGRWSAAKFLDGTGFNAQTLPRDPFEIPDDALTKTPEAARLVEEAAAADNDDDEESEDDSD
jgi:uracil-DNA glycosylase